MSGIIDLQQLLREMDPELLPGTFVFASFPAANYGDLSELEPIAMIKEAEGLTLVLPADTASAHHISFDGSYRMITLNVHSSLEAVGLTAVFSTRLAEHNISANVVAGYYHDHIFVPEVDAERALAALSAI